MTPVERLQVIREALENVDTVQGPFNSLVRRAFIDLMKAPELPDDIRETFIQPMVEEIQRFIHIFQDQEMSRKQKKNFKGTKEWLQTFQFLEQQSSSAFLEALLMITPAQDKKKYAGDFEGSIVEAFHCIFETVQGTPHSKSNRIGIGQHVKINFSFFAKWSLFFRPPLACSLPLY